MLEIILQVVVDTYIDQTQKNAFAALHTSIAIEIIIVSACIWYTASIIRAVFLCSTWILTLYSKQSACVTKDRLEYCLWVNSFCPEGRLCQLVTLNSRVLWISVLIATVFLNLLCSLFGDSATMLRHKVIVEKSVFYVISK